ncbi:MAG: cysteine hydrolase family protein [Burkholderiaceae bacterium]
MGKRALIVVDIQNDYFPGGRWPLQGMQAATDNAARVIAAAREKDELVVYIRHEATSEHAPFFVPGSYGAQLHPDVENRENETVVLKHYINSFRGTELKRILDDAGIDALTVIGSMSHQCIDSITRAAGDFGYETTVIHDACASHDLEFNGVKVPAAQVHAAFMAALEFGHAAVRSTDGYLAA